MTSQAARPVGKTKDAGWQIGARRTFPIPVEDAWRLVTSPEAVAVWLGEGQAPAMIKGASYELDDGAIGEIRAIRPKSHLRITRWPKGRQRASTIQVRVIEKGQKTVIAFHEERLPDAETREARRAHFATALDSIWRLL